jgi:hypothetical protein
MEKEYYEYNKYLKMTEKEYFEKNMHLYEPYELLSDKLKRYSLPSVQKDLSGNLPPYHHYIAKSRKVFNNSITVYKMNKDILDKIKTTTIDKLPNEVPELYNRPFIIEAHEQNSTLFGDIDSIIGFYDDYKNENNVNKKTEKKFVFLFHTKPIKDKNWHDYAFNFCDTVLQKGTDRRCTYLLSNLFYIWPFEDGSFWDFNFVDYSYNVINKKEKCDDCPNSNNCSGKERRLPQFKYHFCLDVLYNNILSFIIVFNYMMKAENSPVKTTKTVEHSTYQVAKKGKMIEKNQDWIIKYMYIEKEKIKYKKNPDPSELDKEGLIAKQVNVRSHLRHQAYGVGHKEHKWILIDSYISNKWVKNGDTKIIVGLKN